MNKKITPEDLKAWEEFTSSKKNIENKDSYLDKDRPSRPKIKKVDLHGFSLDEANQKISQFIENCYLQGVSKINIITGKGLRSQNLNDPYKSKDLSILKYSVPDYIKKNSEIMKKILKIDLDAVKSPSKGNFDIILKSKKK